MTPKIPAALPERHTPGPWKTCAALSAGASHRIFAEEHEGVEGGAIAEVWDRYGEEHANARLIAASPDLLAMLERVSDSFANGDHPDDMRRLGKDVDALLERINPAPTGAEGNR